MIDNIPAVAGAAFNDAWEQYDSAIERLNAGDIREPCGKAWNSTRTATQAAALAHGEALQTANHISGWIRRMGRKTEGFEAMPSMYGARARFLAPRRVL